VVCVAVAGAELELELELAVEDVELAEPQPATVRVARIVRIAVRTVAS
jgi:hypothetical protein